MTPRKSAPFPLNQDVLQRVLELAAESCESRVIGSVVQWQATSSSEVAKYSLVCPSWLEPAQRVLYRSVVLDTSRRADQFARSCEGRPQLGLGRKTQAISLDLTKEIYGAPRTDLVAASERMVDALASCPNVRAVSVGDLDATATASLVSTMKNLDRLSTVVYWETYNEKGVLLPPAALAQLVILPSLRILDLSLYWPTPSELPQLDLGALKSSAPHLETLSLWQGGPADDESDFNGDVLQILSESGISPCKPTLGSRGECSSQARLRHLSLDSLQLGPGSSYPSWLLHTLTHFHRLVALKVPLQDLDPLLRSLPRSVKRLALAVDARDDSGRLDSAGLASVLRSLPKTSFPASLKVLELALEGEPKGTCGVPAGVESHVAALRARGVSLTFVGQDTPLVSIVSDIWA